MRSWCLPEATDAAAFEHLRPGGGRFLRVPQRPSDLERRSGCGPNSSACAVLALHKESDARPQGQTPPLARLERGACTPAPRPWRHRTGSGIPRGRGRASERPGSASGVRATRCHRRRSRHPLDMQGWKASLRMPVLSYRRVAQPDGLYVVSDVPPRPRLSAPPCTPLHPSCTPFTFTPPLQVPNVYREHAVYLHYIAAFYHRLPRTSLFLHGHHQS